MKIINKLKKLVKKIKLNINLLEFEEDLMAKERTTFQHFKMLYYYTFLGKRNRHRFF